MIRVAFIHQNKQHIQLRVCDKDRTWRGVIPDSSTWDVAANGSSCSIRLRNCTTAPPNDEYDW
eukprot:scaffold6740_cov100-Cylindrotheca_fusiformis.AAC.1